MGKILNLASLKAKADAAGVGTTATSSTPNLCPLKSAIVGYVTNGSSTVSISGNWADNQLVPEENVAVGKTITSTETLYRNVTVSALYGGDDIPASGGSSYVYKTVSYEFATKTTYSNGTSTTGTYSSTSTTVYGSTIEASNLGTTEKSRTYIGTSSATLTVAGTSVSVSGAIYLLANQSSSLTLYTDVVLGSSSVGKIPANGGSVRASASVSYKYATKYTYTSGSTSTTSYTSTSTTIYGDYVSGNDLGTTFKSETLLGTSTPSGNVAGSTRVANQMNVYLEANYITSLSPEAGAGYSFHVTYSNIAANGGSASPSYHGLCKYTFSSGSTVTSADTNPFTNVTATYSRSYTGLSSNPGGAFSLDSSTGVVSAPNNTGNSRTAVVTAKLTVSITYTGSYAGVFTACSSSTITHYPPCTLNAHNASSGYIVSTMNNAGTTSPIMDFYYGTTFRGNGNTRQPLGGAYLEWQTWLSTGTVNRIYIAENLGNVKYISINGYGGAVILSKTRIGNYAYYDLTNSFNTSDYNSGTKAFGVTYSNS